MNKFVNLKISAFWNIIPTDEDDVSLELEQEKDLHVGGAARIFFRESGDRA